MDKAQSIFLSARSFFLGTLLSRFGGMFRDIATAACLGSGAEVSAFFVAFRLAHLFRRWIGEGTFQVGFTPHFEELKRESHERALLFFRDALFTLIVGVALLVLVGEGLLGIFVSVSGERWRQIAHLTMWMLPGLIPIGLYSIGSALLQCERRYFLPAAAPALFNAVWIAAAIGLMQAPMSLRVEGLSIAVFFALLAQGALPLGACRSVIRGGLTQESFWRPRLFSKEAQEMMAPLSLGAIGVGAMQLNGVLDSLFAISADPAGPAHLWYAIRVQQLPIGLIGVAMAGALLPPLSRAVAEGERGRFLELLRETLKMGFAVMIPCMVGMGVVGGVGLNLLYGHGAFTSADVVATLKCLWGYGAGLFCSLLVLVGAQGYYAEKNYRRPMWGALAAVGVNVLLNALFVFGLNWGAESVAWATTFSSLVNTWILFWKQESWIPWAFAFEMGAKSVAAGAVAWVVGQFIGVGSWPHEMSRQIVEFGAVGGTFALVTLLLVGKKIRSLISLRLDSV